MTTCRLARSRLWIRDRFPKNHDSISGREGDLYIVQRVQTSSVVFITRDWWAPCALTSERKRQGLESDHSLPSDAKINTAGNLHTNVTVGRYGKATSSTYSECMLVALVIQRARRIRHVTFPNVSCPILNCFPRYLINPLTPNDPYKGRTAPLTSKSSILYIYSTNTGTEYFKHGIYSPFFSLKNAVCFINLTYLVPVLFTFYIQDVLKLKKK